MKEELAENVVQACLFSIIAHNSGSIVIPSYNGTEYKQKVLDEACDQLGIKRLFSHPFHPQGNERVENVNNFLKRTLTNFLGNSDLEWDDLLPFAHYCYNIFPSSNCIESPFFLLFR